MKYLNYISDTLNKIMEIAVALLLGALSILMIISVFFRYVLNNSIYWSNEVCGFLLVFIGFLGSTVAYKHKSHIGVDVLVEKLPDNIQKMLRIFIILGFILFWAVVLYGSIKLLPMLFIQHTSTLQIPYAYPFYIVPITAFIWFVHLICDLTKEIGH